jgi:hypothetical protein
MFAIRAKYDAAECREEGRTPAGRMGHLRRSGLVGCTATGDPSATCLNRVRRAARRWACRVVAPDSTGRRTVRAPQSRPAGVLPGRASRPIARRASIRYCLDSAGLRRARRRSSRFVASSRRALRVDPLPATELAASPAAGICAPCLAPMCLWEGSTPSGQAALPRRIVSLQGCNEPVTNTVTPANPYPFLVLPKLVTELQSYRVGWSGSALYSPTPSRAHT